MGLSAPFGGDPPSKGALTLLLAFPFRVNSFAVVSIKDVVTVTLQSQHAAKRA
jgi:hypothetical protein